MEEKELGISHNQMRKDSREWATICLFRSVCTSFPIGILVKSECPDFILTTKDNKKIGIELTELKYERSDHAFNLRAHEDYLSDVMEGAQRIVERQTDMKLVVDAHFKDELGPAVSVPRDRRSQLMKLGFTEAIARIVLDNIPPSTGQQYIVDRTSKYGDTNLPQKIEVIHIKNMTGRYEHGLYYAGISTRVKPMTQESLEDRLRDKDAKIGHYEQCDEHWLIVIQNSFLMSSLYREEDVKSALSAHYSTKFDRVFVFCRSEAIVNELYVN